MSVSEGPGGLVTSSVAARVTDWVDGLIAAPFGREALRVGKPAAYKVILPSGYALSMNVAWRSENGRRALVAIVAVIVAMTVLPAAYAGTAAAGDSFGPNAVTALDHCQTIDDSGVYVLERNVTGVDGDCFQVAADDVTLLGAGHVLTAGNASGAAVVAKDVSGLHVEGLTAVGWWNGVALTGVERSRITDMTVVDAHGDGFRVTDSTTVDIADTAVTRAGGHGVVVVGSEGVNVTDSVLRNNTGHGISVRESTGTSVRANRIVNNGGVGVRVDTIPDQQLADVRAPSWLHSLSSGSDTRTISDLSLAADTFRALPGLFSPDEVEADRSTTVVSDNRIGGNRYEGVFVMQGSGTRITGNNVTGATDGVRLINVSETTVTENTVTGSVDDGIALSVVTETNVTGNVVTTSGDDGVYVFGSDNAVSSNRLLDNADDGVDLDNATETRVASNWAAKNGDDGVFLRESDGNVVVDNTLRDNLDDGFDIRGSVGNAVFNNTLCGNENRDLQVRLGVDGNDVHDNTC